MNAATIISLFIAALSCIFGIIGWITGHEKNISDDSRWKGTVDQNFKDIKEGVSGIGERMAKVEGAVATLNTQSVLHDSQIQELRQKIEGQEHTT